MKVVIGSRKWNALQEILNGRKDCIDYLQLMDAIVFDARIHKRSTPIWEDDITGESYTTLDVIASAMCNYCDVTYSELEYA